MSRSYRHTPIYGMSGTSEKEDKRQANRKFRRKERIAIASGSEQHIPLKIQEVSDVWSMSKDGKMYYSDNKEMLRK